MRILVISFLLSYSALFSSLTFASQSCSGKWSNTNTVRNTIDLGDGITLTSQVHRGNLTSENSKQQGIGACADVVISYPDGTFRAMYACARKGENGVFVDHGGIEPNAKNGTWKIAKGTGTGDYKNLSANGTWKPILGDDVVRMGSFEGKCKY